MTDDVEDEFSEYAPTDRTPGSPIYNGITQTPEDMYDPIDISVQNVRVLLCTDTSKDPIIAHPQPKVVADLKRVYRRNDDAYWTEVANIVPRQIDTEDLTKNLMFCIHPRPESKPHLLFVYHNGKSYFITP